MSAPLSKKLGLKTVPENRVVLDNENRRPMWDDGRYGFKNFGIREFQCRTCNSLLIAFVHQDLFDGDVVFPCKVICSAVGHMLVPRAEGEDSNAQCYSRAVDEEDAGKYLKKWAEAI
jgi:hypothetical protein